MNDVARDLVARITADYKAGTLRLPGLPDVALRVRRALDDERNGPQELALLIQLDPALTARVIQTANSARYGGRDKVTSCQAAITRLGMTTVRDLVTAFAVSGTFKTRSMRLLGEVKRVWLHSVHLAAISRVLGGIGPELDPERSMLAGLVSGIGVLPVLHYAEEVPELVEDAPRFARVVNTLKGRLGTLVLHRWGFDEDLVRVPLESEQWTRDPDAMPDYADVVLLAKVFTCFGNPHPQYRPPPITDLPAFNKFPLGALGPQGGVELLEEAGEEIARVKRMLLGI